MTGGIRDEETSFLMNTKGIFLLQLMADIHPVFANKYLHKTDSDAVISCETKGIATKTVERLRNLEAPRCMEVYESLYQDRYQNICVKLKDPKNPDATHDLTLNTKVTRHKTLKSHKNDLLQIKDDVIECMIDNINDQVDSTYLMSKLSCLDLESDEGFDERKQNMRALFQTFGTDVEHKMDAKWNNLTVSITYKKRLMCTEEELIKDFDKAIPAINEMGRRLKMSKGSVNPLTQLQLWQEILKKSYLQYPSLCDLVRIMLVIPLIQHGLNEPTASWSRFARRGETI